MQNTQRTEHKEEALEDRLETNDLTLYDVEKLILNLEIRFPSSESVCNVTQTITKSMICSQSCLMQ